MSPPVAMISSLFALRAPSPASPCIVLSTCQPSSPVWIDRSTHISRLRTCASPLVEPCIIALHILTSGQLQEWAVGYARNSTAVKRVLVFPFMIVVSLRNGMEDRYKGHSYIQLQPAELMSIPSMPSVCQAWCDLSTSMRTALCNRAMS